MQVTTNNSVSEIRVITKSCNYVQKIEMLIYIYSVNKE